MAVGRRARANCARENCERRTDDLEAGDVRQEVTYGLVGTGVCLIRTRVVACLDAGVAVVVAVGGAVGAIGMAVGLLRFAGRTHFGCWM